MWTILRFQCTKCDSVMQCFPIIYAFSKDNATSYLLIKREIWLPLSFLSCTMDIASGYFWTKLETRLTVLYAWFLDSVSSYGKTYHAMPSLAFQAPFMDNAFPHFCTKLEKGLPTFQYAFLPIYRRSLFARALLHLLISFVLLCSF